MIVYCVKHIDSGINVYRGPSIMKTASALEPGYCYGWGRTKTEAEQDCEQRRQVILIGARTK